MAIVVKEAPIPPTLLEKAAARLRFDNVLVPFAEHNNRAAGNSLLAGRPSLTYRFEGSGEARCPTYLTYFGSFPRGRKGT